MRTAAQLVTSIGTITLTSSMIRGLPFVAKFEETLTNQSAGEIVRSKTSFGTVARDEDGTFRAETQQASCGFDVHTELLFAPDKPAHSTPYVTEPSVDSQEQELSQCTARVRTNEEVRCLGENFIEGFLCRGLTYRHSSVVHEFWYAPRLGLPILYTVLTAKEERTTRLFDIVVGPQRNEGSSMSGQALESSDVNVLHASVTLHLRPRELPSSHQLDESEDLGSFLISAAERGATDEVLALLAQGADLEFREESGLTALMWAAHYGHSGTLRVLLEAGAEPNARDANEQTALMLSVYHGHLDCVKLLLSAGSEVNARTKQGMTSLMWAAATGALEIVNLLVGYGGDILLTNSDGLTASDLARLNGHVSIYGELTNTQGMKHQK